MPDYKYNTIDEKINFKHKKELLESAIDPSLIELNFRSLEGDQVYDVLCYSDNIDRLNTGRLSAHWLKTYDQVSKGGWYCGTFNSLWGCFKPDHPRVSKDKKVIKYEHPVKEETETYRLLLTQEIIDKIFIRYYGLPNEKINTNNFWIELVNYPLIEIIITEGVKKTASILSQGYCCIGVSGVFNSYKQPKNQYNEKVGKAYLKEGIKEYAQKDRKFTIIFDNDNKPKTIRNVNSAIFKLSVLLKQEKCKVFVAKPYQYKGIDDFIYNLGNDKFNSLIDERIDFDQWVILEKSRLHYDHVVNQRFLELDKLPLEVQETMNRAKLIGLKSAKGTGKTEQLAKLVAKEIRQGNRVLLITHRIQLGRQLADRFGLDYVDEIKDSETGGIFGYGLCIDSLHEKGKGKINIDHWLDCTIIIDEVEQVTSHTLTANTEVKRYRMSIIETLKDLIDVASKVYIADADLSNFSINFISQLGNISKDKTFILNNKYVHKVNRKLISYRDHNPSGLFLELEDQVKQGKKILLLTTGQKIKSRWGSIQLEKYFSTRYPDLKILRIDSESVADTHNAAFGIMEHLNETIKDYDLVIATPTIETGVSINKEIKFNSVFGIFWGMGNSVNSVCQILERYRGDCDRYIWVKPSSIKFYSKATTIQSVRNTITNRKNVLTQFLSNYEYNIFDDSIIDPFNIALDSFCYDIAKFNNEAFAYRKNVESKLVKEGYILEVETTNKQTLKDVSKIVNANQESNYRAYCQVLKQAELLTYSQYLSLDKERQKTEKDRLENKKAKLTYSYFEKNISDELIKRDDNGLYSKVYLLYLLQKEEKQLKESDIKRIEKIKLFNDNKIFSPDLIKDCKSSKVLVFKKLDIMQFLYRDDLTKEAVRPWYESKIERYRDQINEVLGITLCHDPISVLSQLFEMIGISMKMIKQAKNDQGKRERVYLSYIDEINSQILENWLECDRIQEKFNLEKKQVIEFWVINDLSFDHIDDRIEDLILGTPKEKAQNETQKEVKTVDMYSVELGNTKPLYNNIGVAVQGGCSQNLDQVKEDHDQLKPKVLDQFLAVGNSVISKLNDFSGQIGQIIQVKLEGLLWTIKVKWQNGQVDCYYPDQLKEIPF